MPYLIAYIAALAAFLALDFAWMRTVMAPLFRRHVGDLLRERPRYGVAVAFHVVYVAIVLVMAGVPALVSGNWLVAPLYGVLLGLLAYGTYQATNMATLRGWSYGMMAVDILWGAALTAGIATLGYFVAVAAGG